MHKCNKCENSYNNHRALNAHQISHIDREKRFSVSRKKNIQTFYNCINCYNESPVTLQKTNKFCSVNCFTEHHNKKVLQKIESGQILSKNTMRNYLLNTRGICEECGITNTYNGKSITLQCDHIDGNGDNNALNNLRLLCPNCHTQTNTWCGRNKKNTKRNNYLRKYKQDWRNR